MEKLYLQKLKQKIQDFSLDIVVPVFFLTLILEMVHFFPNLQDINIWDEATYIYNGYLLLTTGHLPQLAGSPLSSVLYALTTLPVQHSRNFFVLSDAIGRILLFSFIFFSAYLVARELKPFANPWVMLGFVFIVPVASTMFLFPSDMLFAGFSGLAFWQMLAFYNHRKIKHLWWASALMGLGTLARAEGLILIGVMLIVALLIVFPDKKWYRYVMAVLIPFIVLVGGYILIYGAATGDFRTGLPERTYNNFESGQEGIYSQTGVFIPTISARLEAREAFGTPEENDNSVLKAISRNPRVYWQRLRRMGSVFLNMAIKAYGNKFILIYLWLSIRGIVALIRKNHFSLVLMGMLWFVPWGVGFLNTFIREGYFMMSYFVVFVFSSIGLTAIINNFGSKTERLGLVIGSLGVLLIGALLQNTSMLYRNGLFIFALGLFTILWLRGKLLSEWRVQAFWIIFAMALIMRGGYPSPELPSYGRTDVERSVYVLQDSLPVGSGVLAGAPANIWAARMTYYGINSYDIPEFINAEDFLDWMQVQGMDAVYVDQHFPQVYREYVNALIGDVLTEIYATPENDILIYQLAEGED